MPSEITPLKTTEEIEDLKRQWLDDPCWDIADTKGFEAHKEELQTFQDKVKAADEARIKELQDRRKIMTYLDDITYGSRAKADDEISEWVSKGWTVFNVAVFTLDEGDGVSFMRSTTLIRS